MISIHYQLGPKKDTKSLNLKKTSISFTHVNASIQHFHQQLEACRIAWAPSGVANVPVSSIARRACNFHQSCWYGVT